MELKHTARRDGPLSVILREDMAMSYGLMNRLKWDEKLLVNGIPQRTNFPVKEGDVVSAILDEPKPDYPAEDLPVEILYEDEHILAVDKPAGMLIHPSRSQFCGTLANRVIGYYEKTGQTGAFHPVTRLDRDTYGVVLLGKNSYAHAMLSDLHDNGGLEKVYEAAVYGKMPGQEGIIDAPIHRRPLPSLLRYVNQVFSTLDCAKTELLQSAMLQGQHVSLASVASTQWVDMVTAFSQEYPHFTLLCTSVTRAGLVGSGLSAQHSFLLAAEEDVPDFYSDKLDSAILFEDHPVVLVHKDHPLARGKSVDISVLREENIFLPLQGYSLRDRLMQMFADCGIPFPAGNAYSHLATQQMVGKGLGVAFVTSHTALGNPQQLRVLPVSNDYQPWVCRLYWRKNKVFTRDEEMFKDFVLRYYQK